MKQTIEIEVPDGKKTVWKDNKVVFEDIKPKLPKTWEEFCKQNNINKEEVTMNENIDLTKILKDCPKRTEFWSDDYGIVRFDSIIIGADTPIRVTRPDEYYSRYTKEGWHCKEMPGSCLLWPSRDCRDWSKLTAPWLKKERFDPKTLQPFDRVIVKPDNGDWHCSILSHREDNNIYYRMVDGYGYSRIIPYNDDTKHLIGTTKEAPDFYKYWEN